MKTTNLMKNVMVVALAALVIAGCKKKEDKIEPEDQVVETTTQTATASDQNNVDLEVTAAMEDVNKTLNNVSKIRGIAIPCNIDLDTATLYKGLIKLTFNGLSCDLMRKREGVISVQLPYNGDSVTSWSTKGAAIIVKYEHYKVTRISDGKSIMFDGEVSVTNVQGGNFLTLISGSTPTVTHKSRGRLEITFDDGTKCSWGLAASMAYNYSNLLFSTTETGDSTVNGNANTSFWGVTRKGENFSVSVTTPVVTNLWGNLCLYRPTGVRVIRGISHELTITYGVDITGNPVAQGACPFGYRLNWVDANSAAKVLVLPYL